MYFCRVIHSSGHYSNFHNIHRSVVDYVLYGTRVQTVFSVTQRSHTVALEKVEQIHARDMRMVLTGGCEQLCADQLRKHRITGYLGSRRGGNR